MKRSFLVLPLVLILAAPLLARADSVQTIGEYSGSTYFNPGPFPPLTTVGTFNITPGDTAITISGTFGNSAVSSSADANLYLGSVLVAQCPEGGLCNTVTTPFSDTLTAAEIASLGTGTVDFSVLQTSEYNIRLGVTTLDQMTGESPVPEPSSLALLGTGVLGAIGVVRRRLRA